MPPVRPGVLGAMRHRADANQTAVVAVLRKCGWIVANTSGVGYGFPDVVAVKGSRVEFCEIKNGASSKADQVLTPAQEKFHAAFLRAGVVVKTIRSVDDAVKL